MPFISTSFAGEFSLVLTSSHSCANIMYTQIYLTKGGKLRSFQFYDNIMVISDGRGLDFLDTTHVSLGQGSTCRDARLYLCSNSHSLDSGANIWHSFAS